MGHGLNNTVQDVLIRFERMRGAAALWLPGTDHAGIATQNVVERLLAKEGLTRFDLGREAFVERVWAFVRETGGAILEQLKAIGGSADWTRTYFTLDEDLSRGSARGVRRALRAGPGLPRPLHHPLVSALPHRALRRGSGEGGDRRQALAPAVSARRRQRPRHRGDDAARDDARRHGGGRAPRGRAVPAPDRSARSRLPLVDRRIPIVADEAVDSGVRHRRREDHARPRPDRLRGRPAARAAQPST